MIFFKKVSKIQKKIIYKNIFIFLKKNEIFEILKHFATKSFFEFRTPF
jgi:hypothetical protein